MRTDQKLRDKLARATALISVYIHTIAFRGDFSEAEREAYYRNKGNKEN